MSGEPTADVAPQAPDGESAALPGKRVFARPKTSLLVGIAVAAVTLLIAWYLIPARPIDSDDEAAISPAELFRQQCGYVTEQRLTRFHLADSPVTDEMVAELANMDWLETVILDQGVVTDKGLESIVRLPKLQHLRLRLSPITDHGLSQLAACKTLWYLNLPHAECTVDGIAQLQALPKLRQLRIGSNRLSNDVTEAITKLPGLRGIHLIGVPITDEGLDELAAMPYLESLYLDDSAVTEAGWERLFRQHPDLHVHINQRHHDRDPKAHAHHD